MFTRKKGREYQAALKVISQPAPYSQNGVAAQEFDIQNRSNPVSYSEASPLLSLSELTRGQPSNSLPLQYAEANRVPACDGIVIIGKGARIAGDISDCILVEIQGVLEGKVEAKSVVVREGGGFQGTLSAESAEISGLVEGTIAVTGALSVRASGDITAETTYGHLSVEHGGKIHGNFKAATKTPTTLPGTREEPAIPSINGMIQQESPLHRAGGRHPIASANSRLGSLNS